LSESLDTVFAVFAGIVSQISGIPFKAAPDGRGYREDTLSRTKCFRMLLRDYAVMLIGPYFRSLFRQHPNIPEWMIPLLSAFIESIASIVCQYLEVDPAFFSLDILRHLGTPCKHYISTIGYDLEYGKDFLEKVRWYAAYVVFAEFSPWWRNNSLQLLFKAYHFKVKR
jgi:hypothetical protein